MNLTSQPEPDRSPGAFAKLAQLLQGLHPKEGLTPVYMHLGEVQAPPPEQLLAPLHDLRGWCNYPPLGGTPELRQAYAAWLHRRFGVAPGPAESLEPTAGTKHAISSLVGLAVQAARRRMLAQQRPVVAMPSPFYPTFEAATFESGAVPAYFDPTASEVVRSLSAVLDSAGGQLAAVVLCHPCSPSGEVYDAKKLVEIAALARQHQTPLFVDECYVDIYLSDRPISILQLVANGQLPVSGLVVMHTLSKRSAAPGIRSGFVTGDPEWVFRFSRWNRTCGVSSALPICRAAERLWSDDLHVHAVRKQLQANWDCADQILSGLPGYTRPASGFFLWLPVADDEELTCRAWSTAAIKVLPGSYLRSGFEPRTTGGTRHVRIALVHEPAVTSAALDRLRSLLTSQTRATTHAQPHHLEVSETTRQMPALRILVSPPNFSDWSKLLMLLRESFAYMESLIDPPSSVSRMDIEELQAKVAEESLIVVAHGEALVGCAFATLRDDSVYVGKVAVAACVRKKGIARALLVAAENLAREHNRNFLELQTRIELVEIHSAFGALGFEKVAETAHPGYERPTSITMRRLVAAKPVTPKLFSIPFQETYDA